MSSIIFTHSFTAKPQVRVFLNVTLSHRTVVCINNVYLQGYVEIMDD